MNRDLKGGLTAGVQNFQGLDGPYVRAHVRIRLQLGARGITRKLNRWARLKHRTDGTQLATIYLPFNVNSLIAHSRDARQESLALQRFAGDSIPSSSIVKVCDLLAIVNATETTARTCHDGRASTRCTIKSKRFHMVRLILVRHGHVEGIHPPRFRGRRDLDLSEHGTHQAERTAERIARSWRPTVIYTSPLRRCIQTGAAIARGTGARAEVLDDLNDLHYGDWEWRTHAEVQAEWPEVYERWRAAPHLVRFPNGESLHDLAARVSNVIRLILSYDADETVVVVGHDSGNRALLLQLLESPISSYWRITQDPCGVSEAEVHTRHATVRRINETGHLDES
jgi:phosphoserine phosphatase